MIVATVLYDILYVVLYVKIHACTYTAHPKPPSAAPFFVCEVICRGQKGLFFPGIQASNLCLLLLLPFPFTISISDDTGKKPNALDIELKKENGTRTRSRGNKLPAYIPGYGNNPFGPLQTTSQTNGAAKGGFVIHTTYIASTRLASLYQY